jgi:ParB family chromosome partitioning protein
MREFKITQESLAKRIGKQQSTVANKLRVLKLSPEALQTLRQNGLTERHARAVLKLTDEETQLAVLKAAGDNEMNVRQTEQLVEDLLAGSLPEKDADRDQPTSGKQTRIIKDIRIFLNSIKKVVSDIKKVGISAQVEQEVTPEAVTLTIKIPQRNPGKSSRRKAASKDVSRETPAPGA